MPKEVRIGIYSVATGILAILATQDFVEQNTVEAILQTVTSGTSLTAAVITWVQRRNERSVRDE